MVPANLATTLGPPSPLPVRQPIREAAHRSETRHAAAMPVETAAGPEPAEPQLDEPPKGVEVFRIGRRHLEREADVALGQTEREHVHWIQNLVDLPDNPELITSKERKKSTLANTAP